MSTASRGRSYEHKVRDDMIGYGWFLVARSAGSKGAADLVMVHPDHGLALVQVKTDSGSNLGPDDRERLTYLALLCSALPLLAVVTPRQPIRYWEVTRDVPSKWDEWSPVVYAVLCDGCGDDVDNPTSCDHGRTLCPECVDFVPCRHCKREMKR